LAQPWTIKYKGKAAERQRRKTTGPNRAPAAKGSQLPTDSFPVVSKKGSFVYSPAQPESQSNHGAQRQQGR